MTRHPNGIWSKSVNLPDGTHSYKFIVDGKWCFDVLKDTQKDATGNVNNVITLGAAAPKQAKQAAPEKKGKQEKAAPAQEKKGKAETAPAPEKKQEKKGKAEAAPAPEKKGKAAEKSAPVVDSGALVGLRPGPTEKRVGTAHRTVDCGSLRITDVGKEVKLSGWVQKCRPFSHFLFIDLRDRYGITQVVIAIEQTELFELAQTFGREWVIEVTGKVVERSQKNKDRETGEIEIYASEIKVLNKSKVPPFTIENDTDGMEDIRMKFRYLDIRRAPIRNNLILRHQVGMLIRNFLTGQGFVEVETPVLIKSTPEGARDFVVPSRMNPGTFYALPQSPQTFKQLLMVGGLDKYYQIVKCFRDEELRADRQPEFTQIDCEMSFVDQEDIIGTFEPMIRYLFKETIGESLPDPFPRMLYADAMKYYGVDKPDVRFGMTFVEMTDLTRGRNFDVFDKSELVVGIAAPGMATYSKKQLDELIKLAKSPEIGAGGLVWVKVDPKGPSSSADKFFKNDLPKWVERFQAKPGDLLCIFAGPAEATRVALGRFRLALGSKLGLRDPNVFKALWVVDFPLLEWDQERNRWMACHHPFTSAYPEDEPLFESNPGAVRARAYDLVINGIEVGGGSIRMHNRDQQMKTLKRLGFTEEQAEEQFGFLMRAFEYGAPPHGGLAFGFDRLCSIIGKEDNIRTFIAFPKNKEGRDTMIEAPSPITDEQLNELSIAVVKPPKKE